LFVITPYPAVVAMCVAAEVEPNFITEEDPIYNVISIQIKETRVLKSFLGTFEKLRKATISFLMSVRQSVCLFVRVETLGCHCMHFFEIWYLRLFRKSVEKIQA
jgi:hypothetical protein